MTLDAASISISVRNVPARDKVAVARVEMCVPDAEHNVSLVGPLSSIIHNR